MIISCGYKQAPIYIYPDLSNCNKPNKPQYSKLNEKYPITSSENLYTLISNILKLKYYSKSLENTLSCYENQIKESKSDNRK